LRADRVAFFHQFIREYETIRRAEGRASADPAYYRALPFHDLSGRMPREWSIRAAGFRALVARVIAPSESSQPLKILDLGAGNGWLSYRLAQRGHIVAAVDLLTNAEDGLGTHIHYDAAFTPVQAEFDALPFTREQVDFAIFNSSLHYSTDYAATLSEALRVVRPTGRVVVLDTPIYCDGSSGVRMVAERQAQFQLKYGFPSNALKSENYLTYDRVQELGQELGIEWQAIKVFRGWRWALRPWVARARGQREPAELLLMVGRRN
jgi:SAM-dependent methyltransferase